QRFDFLSDDDYRLETIQTQMRQALLADTMTERTIWGLFGLTVDGTRTLGDRTWIVPATDRRRSHLASPSEPTYPLIHAHCYLVCDRIVSSAELREGKRDPQPLRAVNCLRAVVRADLK